MATSGAAIWKEKKSPIQTLYHPLHISKTGFDLILLSKLERQKMQLRSYEWDGYIKEEHQSTIQSLTMYYYPLNLSRRGFDLIGLVTGLNA